MTDKEVLKKIKNAKKEKAVTLLLNDCQLQHLPKEIGQLQNLQELYLSENELQSLPKEIVHLQNLKILDLNG